MIASILLRVVSVTVVLAAWPLLARAGEFCRARAHGSCEVAVDSPSGTFADLQEAIDAADDGATITVTGVCSGPLKVYRRRNLSIQGAPPSSGCPANGPGPGGLTSTLRGSGREVIRVRASRNIEISFLNIVSGRKGGVKIEDSEDGAVTCNCVAVNGGNGIKIQSGSGHRLEQNLVAMNADDGILLRDSKHNEIRANTVGGEDSGNKDDGIAIEDDSHRNRVTCNHVENNREDGIDIDYSDKNHIQANEVLGNGRDPDKDNGIELRESDRNLVDDNRIIGNSDGLVNQVRCQRGSRKNTGSNVTHPCGSTTSAPQIACPKDATTTTTTTTLPAGQCGDLRLDDGEACDDGNTEDGDCCSSTCQWEPAGNACGDGPTECSGQDTCDGRGACLANDLASGTPCGDEGTRCTRQDTCNGEGSCRDNGFQGAGTPCGDQSDTECTDPDTCDGQGSCQVNHARPGTACGDQGVACREDDSCDGSGSCQDGGFSQGTDCEDGNPCTVGDRCREGSCVSGSPVDCDDGNPCTDDTCDPAVGCVHTSNTAPCDLGNPCTTGDSCSAGFCLSGSPVDCDDGNPRTDDTCDPAVGCVHTDNNEPCE